MTKEKTGSKRTPPPQEGPLTNALAVSPDSQDQFDFGEFEEANLQTLRAMANGSTFLRILTRCSPQDSTFDHVCNEVNSGAVSDPPVYRKVACSSRSESFSIVALFQ